MNRAAMRVVAGALLAACLASGALAGEKASYETGAWIRKFEALRFDPDSIYLASREPLRFAVIGRAWNPPRPLRGSDRIRLAAVDTASNDVRVFELEPAMITRTMTLTPDGRWRWLGASRKLHGDPYSLQVMELAPGDAAPRALGTLPDTFDPLSYLQASRGEECWLMSGTYRSNPGEMPPPRFAFIDVAEGSPRMHAAPELRGARIWVSPEKAFVVQTMAQQPEYVLLDCAGRQRPLPDLVAARIQYMNRWSTPAIAANGDWAFDAVSPKNDYGDDYLYSMTDEIRVIQGKLQNSFGPRVIRYTGRCTDTGCDYDSERLADPEFSPSGQYLLVQGDPRAYVLRTKDLVVMHKWRSGGGQSLLLSDSTAMRISKSRGVSFERW